MAPECAHRCEHGRGPGDRGRLRGPSRKHCRQDLCELQVAGRIGSNLDADMRDIQQALGSMRQMPWWAALQFDQETGTVGSAPDGRVIALWFLSRK